MHPIFSYHIMASKSLSYALCTQKKHGSYTKCIPCNIEVLKIRKLQHEFHTVHKITHGCVIENQVEINGHYLK